MQSHIQVTVVGLGYVGLPLAVALARHFQVVGLDIDEERIAELAEGVDRTNEVEPDALRSSGLKLTADPLSAPASDFIIVTVPTPVDSENRPDLTLVRAASKTVASMLKPAVSDGRSPIVIYESTVYPGVTEDICAPILEQGSGLQSGFDFFLAYSPERINPGDREHTIDKITKVVSGQTPETLDRVAVLYETITSGGVFRASSIRAAEAAKVIENAQRDLNIAFMNEISQIFAAVGISVWDVLEAARTKWNFLPFTPGLVGGHCIGVDPYYLSYLAERLGLHPQVILAGRGVNDGMAAWIAQRLHDCRAGRPGSVLVLGLTFKENIPDLRNSKVVDVVTGLQTLGHDVTVHDPLADPRQALEEYAIELDPTALDRKFDLVFLAVPHRVYMEADLRGLVAANGTLADLKGVMGGTADWTL